MATPSYSTANLEPRMGRNLDRCNIREHYDHESGTSLKTSFNIKRVWVKGANGIPTSVMITRQSLVDDLKSTVHNKFSNSLGKHYDSSDLQIFAKPIEKQHHIALTTKNSPINRLKTGAKDIKKDSSVKIDKRGMLSLLEPDKNVWELIDVYYGGEMGMRDALIIGVSHDAESSNDKTSVSLEELSDSNTESFTSSQNSSSQNDTKKTSSTSALHVPKLSHSLQNTYSQDKTNDRDKNSSESPISQTVSQKSGNMKQLKRSESSNTQSAISMTSQSRNHNSQAVLLLPKNFSLSEQPLAKFTQGDKSVPESGSNSKNTVSKTMSFDRQTYPIGFKDSREKSFELGEDKSDSTTKVEKVNNSPKVNPGVQMSESNDSKSESGSPARTTDRASGSRLDFKEITINTSTFEQVLPSISVLVVEDNSINQAILGAFLRKHKIHYQIAKNGQEAVDKWRKGGFHLVLMDIQLPVKSGIEATKEIRLLERVNSIGVFAQHELTLSNKKEQLRIRDDQKLDLSIFRSPVIIVALTASSNSSVDKKNALTAGCNDFLTKPVNLVWLQNKITEWGCMQALIDFDGWRKGAVNSTAFSDKKTQVN